MSVVHLQLENHDEPASVDEADYEKVRPYKWYISKLGYVYGYFGYDVRKLLHRFLCGVTEYATQVDHRDHNPLNCTRENLRVCTNQQNSSNRRKGKGYTSRFKGVCWTSRYQRWRATITYMYKQVHIGYFDDECEAARAYDHKALQLFGEFSLLNFPNVDYSKYSDPIKRKGVPTSRHCGISRRASGRWVVRISIDGVRKYVGSFSSENTALVARNRVLEKAVA